MTYADCRSRINDRVKVRRAAERRRREEQSEARALGVQVVDKINIDRTWSEAEEAALCQLYPDYPAMQSRLPHRSYKAIKHRCADLGLQGPRPGAAAWTAAQMRELRKIYKTASVAELRAAFPQYTLRQIHSRANAERLQRPKPALQSTGVSIIDTIRTRAKQLNYTMRDLDCVAATGEFFQSRGWRRTGCKRGCYSGHTQIARAVVALGGVLTVSWED